ncbi:disease resistance protein RPV1 [Lactuca sativa]|uniref:TIR domain-containing protein n=1 Tax=Lactuca sativa TaxID=4236 RepID=A0A9R1VPB5_LACSA|nr:disease resistance protein RPV1 [Lactuca sativa]KAJ0208407.1 hypothetical protein LSAT_V11C500243350 [Lactuca sativa]
MASSSTSSIYKSFKYDVFLSFRGEDTRTNFVDHLYYALQQKNIHTYKDDDRIKKGKRICDELIRSIEDSKFYIIVFSKNYASSSWCLDELVKIMECHKTTEHTAYPIFYDVEPSEVRRQSGAVEKAFADHENEEAAEKWRGALKEAADLAGWELKNTADRHEAKFIQKVVGEISLELRSVNFSIDETLVGMETRIYDVLSSLGTSLNDVRMIGIKGMGGGGKTTLARAVFDQISFQFEGASFVENVREVSNVSLSGLKSLQNQILSDIIKDQGIVVSSVYHGKSMMKRWIHGKKVLLVLDDVDHIEQLEALAGEMNWFKPGSRIIITTRDEQVLIAHRVKSIHNVRLFLDEEAICLFSRYAFGRVIPDIGYEALSQQVVHYAAGLPLTIKVLGSFLCGKNELEWVDALKRLKTIPLLETLKKLEISYISLEEDYKEIFLDVACIFKGWSKDFAIKVLESCGYHARTGLRVLEQKSLITIYEDSSDDEECLGMHDHIEEMGRNIVRRLHPDKPNKHSRLWITKEIEDVLTNDLGTEETRYIKFDTRDLNPEILMKGLRKMKELRFLYVRGESKSECSHPNWKFSKFPDALRYLQWNYYPFRSLPKTFKANNLAALEMNSSKIIQLWEGGERKVFNKLRILDLSWSRLRTLDLGLTPNIETLNLIGCRELVDLHMLSGSIKLITLDLSGSMLRTLDLGSALNLELLDLTGCSVLVELHMPDRSPHLRSIKLGYSKLRTLDIGLTPNLEYLDLEKCSDLKELHMGDECQKLTFLNISRSKFKNLDLKLTPNLKTLDLKNCYNLVELHMLAGCKKLIGIDLSWSELRSLDLGSALNLMLLDLTRCSSLVELHMPDRSPNLRSIKLGYSKVRTLDIGLTPNLEYLDLEMCSDLEELHIGDECQKLTFVNIRHSKIRNLDLSLTPNIKTLDLNHCSNLVELHMLAGCIKLETVDLSWSGLMTLDLGSALNLWQLDLTRCSSLVELHMADRSPNLRSIKLGYSKIRTLDIGLTPNLEYLDLEMCSDLEELHMGDICQKLRLLNIRCSKISNLDLRLTPNLNTLDLKNCSNLVELHMDNESLKKIVFLDLSGCLRFISFKFDMQSKASCSEVGPLAELHLIAESLDGCPLHPDINLPKFQFKCFYKEDRPLLTRNLEKLISFGLCACTDLDTFSRSICGLEGLRELKLQGSIPEVPKDLDQLQCLETLHISCTNNIRHLPDNICMLKHLKSLELSCRFLEKLPKDLDRLECLEKLTLSSEKIKDIPDCIFMLKHLQSLELSCQFLEKLPEDLGQLECLRKLSLSSEKIKDIPDSIYMLKHLESLELSCQFLEKLPEDLGRLEGLKKLTLSSEKIKDLPDSICMLKHLESLQLYDCLLLERLPEDLGRLECLRNLCLTSAKIKYLPDSICMLKHLESLELDDCSLLEKLPEDLDRLERLEILNLSFCKLLQDIPASICKMKCLKYLNLCHCACISHISRIIILSSGLRICGSRELLQSLGFRSMIQTIDLNDDVCYVDM